MFRTDQFRLPMLACPATNKFRFDIAGWTHVYTLMCYTYVWFCVEIWKY